jgi:F0F1-type ATP synthase assembly protein I
MPPAEPAMPSENPPPRSPTSAGLMVMGSELAGFTVVGLLVDYALGTLPWFTVGLTLFGFGIVFYHMILISKAMSRRDKPGGKSL